MAHFDDDAIADFCTLEAACDLDHFACGFDTRRERQFRLELIFTSHHQDVGKVDAGGAHRDSNLTRLKRPGGKSLQTQAFGRAKLATDDGLRHQAALAFPRAKASRISGRGSLPKYLSVLARKMVGEPNPPRAITSSVLALSWSLIACWPMPAKNSLGPKPTRRQTS